MVKSEEPSPLSGDGLANGGLGLRMACHARPVAGQGDGNGTPYCGLEDPWFMGCQTAARAD
jgi:hypothetical protein